MKHLTLSLCTTVLFVLSKPLFAQNELGTSLQSLPGSDRSGQAAAMVTREIAPVARTVDPEHYFCGAGDVMSLVLTMPLNLEVLLQVTADGALMIPRLGAVQVSGKTLAQARQDVFEAMRKKWRNAEGALALTQARPVLVTISGEVTSPGLLTLTAATPVSVALRMAETYEQKPAETTTLQLQTESNKDPGYRARLSSRYFGGMDTETRATRRIVIQHADGTSSRADIPMYEATRNGAYDPFLREGDVIVVPRRDGTAPVIGVLGAVRRPGTFEFIEGDKLSDLLGMGFGIDESRTITGGKLSREGLPTLTFSVSELSAASFADDVELRPGDRLIVYAEKPRSRSGSAVIDGEVVRPGAFSITPGKTTLRELVDMAGGFTEEAWPGLSVLSRSQRAPDGLPLDLDREREKNFEKSGLYIEDTLSWAISSRLREGQVAVDFYTLFIRGDNSADVTLEDGDILLVPRNTGTVYVFGQVINGGFVPWAEGKNLEWYIEKAGGYSSSATKHRTAVIKANTRAWLAADDAVIEPGDMIYVPDEPRVALAKTTDILAVVAAVVGGLAGTVGLVVSLLK